MHLHSMGPGSHYLGELLRELAGKDDVFLLLHFVKGLAGRNVLLESLFSQNEQSRLVAELTRRAETETAYASGERRTWRREHLGGQELAGIRRPRVDEFVLDRLRGHGHDPEVCRPGWPDGHRFALCITHDVDHVSQNNWREKWRSLKRQKEAPPGPPEQRRHMSPANALRATASSAIRRHGLRAPDPLARIAETMKLEENFGFRSTFYFFVSGVGEWHPWDLNYDLSDRVPFAGRMLPVRTIMQELAAAEWEIGLHPSYHAAASSQWLRKQKDICEEACGREVVSVRQHTLQYHPELTPALQSEAGLLIDSTHGFNDLIGYRAGTCFPYLCWDHRRGATLPLLELPLHIQDGPLMRGTGSVEEAVESAVGLMETTDRLGGCLVILWHPQWLGTDAGLAVFRAILQEGKRRNAWGCTTRELAAWWLARTERLMRTEVTASL